MHHNILVPVDLTNVDKFENSVTFLDKLLGDEDHVTFMNVIEPIPVYVTAELPPEYVDTDNIKGDCQKRLEALVVKHGLKDRANVVVRIGYPYNEILDMAEQINANLIVMGSHKPEWEDYLLGSTAAKVVRHANCSVLVQR